MWEICTLGKTLFLLLLSRKSFCCTGSFPYPSISCKDLLLHVREGNRLSCPENCSEEL